MSNLGCVLLAGASRGVGREIATKLVSRGYRVKALLRSPVAQPELEAEGITVAFADALDAEAVQRVMAAEPIQAVISTIGGKSAQGERSDYLGNRNLIAAAVQTGVQKFILVSSIGSGNSAIALPPQVLQTLSEALVEKEQAENYLQQSGLVYTIVRPGGLKSEPGTGNGVLTTDPTVAGTIHRADVAELVCACLQFERANHQVFSAIDRQMSRSDRPFEEFVLN